MFNEPSPMIEGPLLLTSTLRVTDWPSDTVDVIGVVGYECVGCMCFGGRGGQEYAT